MAKNRTGSGNNYNYGTKNGHKQNTVTIRPIDDNWRSLPFRTIPAEFIVGCYFHEDGSGCIELYNGEYVVTLHSEVMKALNLIRRY